MPKIVPIVEGPGDVEAAPILIRKLLWEMGRYDIQVAHPKNAHGCGNLTKTGGLEKFVAYAGLEPDCGAVPILMDADEQCPKELATALAKRVRAMGVKRPIVIVIAKCEFEAWFLASLQTVSAKLTLLDDYEYPGDVEARGGVKAWLSEHFPPGRIYKETLDQAAMTELIDPTIAQSCSRSFRRLCRAVEQALRAIDTGQVLITPGDPME